MKERIRMIMESQKLSQQDFAQFIGISPASLSSIFNDRTKPTINIIEAIKSKIPTLSTDWLIFGVGQMYANDGSDESGTEVAQLESNVMGDFFGGNLNTNQNLGKVLANQPLTSNAMYSMQDRPDVMTVSKPQRQITEIRIFYDDQTWETFTPSK